MKYTLLSIIAYAGLALTIVPSLLVFSGSMAFETHKQWMLAGFVMWFAGAYWRRK